MCKGLNRPFLLLPTTLPRRSCTPLRAPKRPRALLGPSFVTSSFFLPCSTRTWSDPSSQATTQSRVAKSVTLYPSAVAVAPSPTLDLKEGGISATPTKPLPSYWHLRPPPLSPRLTSRCRVESGTWGKDLSGERSSGVSRGSGPRPQVTLRWHLPDIPPHVEQRTERRGFPRS